MKYYIIASLFLLLYCNGHAFDFVSKQKELIRGHYAQKNYFQCIDETRRLLAYVPDLPKRNDFNYFIEANYFLGKQYKSVVAFSTNKDRSLRSTVLSSQAFLRMGFFDKAFAVTKNISYDSLPEKDRSDFFYHMQELYLFRNSYASMLIEFDMYQKTVGSLASVSGFRQELLTYRNISIKSPVTALMLSVFVPGSGQIYAGKYIEGILSFASVFGTAYAAYHFRERKQLSATLMFFSSLFYLGNVYGAYNSAVAHNNNSYNTFNSAIRQKYIPEFQPIRDLQFLN